MLHAREFPLIKNPRFPFAFEIKSNQTAEVNELQSRCEGRSNTACNSKREYEHLFYWEIKKILSVTPSSDSKDYTACFILIRFYTESSLLVTISKRNISIFHVGYVSNLFMSAGNKHVLEEIIWIFMKKVRVQLWTMS